MYILGLYLPLPYLEERNVEHNRDLNLFSFIFDLLSNHPNPAITLCTVVSKHFTRTPLSLQCHFDQLNGRLEL